VKTVYNKNILIFEAGEGLGKAVAMVFAREKACIIAVDRNKTNLGNLEREIGNLRANIKGYLCDLFSRKEVEKTIKEIMRNHNSIDILVLGFTAENKSLFVKTSTEHIEKILSAQIMVPCIVVRNLLEHMSEKKESAIISIPLMNREPGTDGILDAMSLAAFKSMIAETEKFSKTIKSHIQFIKVESAGKKTDLFFAANLILDAVIKAKSEVSI
jgi:NAD(P)-dependent dehydrogenase (short-subunit alcohol dehydrogenase family)